MTISSKLPLKGLIAESCAARSNVRQGCGNELTKGKASFENDEWLVWCRHSSAQGVKCLATVECRNVTIPNLPQLIRLKL